MARPDTRLIQSYKQKLQEYKKQWERLQKGRQGVMTDDQFDRLMKLVYTERNALRELERKYPSLLQYKPGNYPEII